MMRRSILASLALLALVGCPGSQVKKDDPKAEENAKIHYDLGVNAEQSGDVRSALNEFNEALRIDPNLELAENALGVLYHLSFRQLDEAERHYRRALEIKKDFSDAKVNLGNLYLDQGRYDEAIALYEEALHDIQYKKPWFPANNEGWAWFKKGQTDHALTLIQEAVRVNGEFCAGYRNLGLIYESQGRLELAQTELEKVVKKCPDVAQGHYDLGVLQLRAKQETAARKSFGLCRDHAKEGDPLQEECTKLAGGGT